MFATSWVAEWILENVGDFFSNPWAYYGGYALVGFLLFWFMIKPVWDGIIDMTKKSKLDAEQKQIELEIQKRILDNLETQNKIINRHAEQGRN